MAVRVGPSFFPGQESGRIEDALGGYEAFESGKPMFIIAGAVVRLVAIGSSLDFFGQCGGPLFPREMPFFGKPHGEREGLRLPRLRENRPGFVAGKAR